MLNQLKKSLGIVDLAGLIADHIEDEKEQRGVVNDHLVEIKELIKSHDVQMDKKVFNHHLDVLTHLGRILSALEPSKAVLLGKEDRKPTHDEKTEEDLKKVLTCLESFKSHYVSPVMIATKVEIEVYEIERLLNLLFESNKIERRDDHFFRSIPLYIRIPKAIIDIMSRYPDKIFYRKELKKCVPFTESQIVYALSFLKKQGKIDRVEPGHYRITQRKHPQQ